MAKFFLRTKLKKGISPIYYRIRKRKPSIDLSILTKIEVDIETWVKANQSADSLSRFERTKDGKALFSCLNTIANNLDNLINSGHYTKEMIDEIVNTVVYEDARRTREALIADKEAKKRAEQGNPINSLKKFLEGIEKGSILTKGNKPYTKNTIKVWKSFAKTFSEFYNRKPFVWADINKSLNDQWRAFLVEKDYMSTTANKYTVNFKTLFTWAKEQHYHKVEISKAILNKNRVNDSDKATAIYLTEKELEALYNMKLSNLKEVVRDIFLIGTYTAQRISDYNNLKESNFTTTARGVKVVKLEQEKTNTAVVIPIINDNLLTIAKKYNFKIPKISDVIINRYIKEICKDLSVTVPSLSKELETKLTLKERTKGLGGKETILRPRYEMVCSHTARRSGITNLYLTGKFTTLQLMSISGHKTEKQFFEYVKLSSEEIAEEITKILVSGQKTELF